MISGIRITTIVDVQSGIPENGRFERRQAGFETRQAGFETRQGGFETSSHPFSSISWNGWKKITCSDRDPMMHVEYQRRSRRPVRGAFLGDDRQQDAGQTRRCPREKSRTEGYAPLF
jgi:hypothetical protein